MRVFALSLALLFALPVLGEEAVDLAQAVKELGSPDFEVRERATQRLASAGEPARSLLVEAAKSEDAEVKARAESLIQALDAKFKAQADARNPQPGNVQADELVKLLRAAQPVARRNVIQIAGPGMNVAIDQNDIDMIKAIKGEEIEGLGLRAGACQPELADQLKAAGGVVVREVLKEAPGVPLKLHDVIVAAAGKPVASLEDLKAAVKAAGEKPLELTVIRKGEKQAVIVDLGR